MATPNNRAARRAAGLALPANDLNALNYVHDAKVGAGTARLDDGTLVAMVKVDIEARRPHHGLVTRAFMLDARMARALAARLMQGADLAEREHLALSDELATATTTP